MICWLAHANFISCHHRQCLFDIYLICWLLWIISEYYCAFFGYIDTLPLGLCLIDIICFDNAGILLCLLWLYRYFASWATLPLGLASWATLPLGLLCLLGLPLGLLCLLGYFNMLPLGPCLIDIVCFDNVGILICLLGCAITGHLLVCKMISYVNMPNRDTL
jgi:hypothetical protein